MFFYNGVEVTQEIVHRDAISVQMRLQLDEETFESVGVARRHPTDRFDEEVGLKLAYSRALAQLAAKLEKQSSGRMKHNEDMQVAKAASKESKRVNEFWGEVLRNHKPLQKQSVSIPKFQIKQY